MLEQYYTEKRIFDDLPSLGGRILSQNENCAVCQIENDTGNGVITIYHVFPGVKLLFSDMQMSEFKGHSTTPFQDGENVMEISYCREGRFEVELTNGEYAYIGGGDVAVNLMSGTLISSFFPLAHFHGISIFVDITLASKTIEKVSAVLGTMRIDIMAIKEKLCPPRPYFVMRSPDSIKHIFSELYEAPGELKESHIKLKVMELLLRLNAMKADMNPKRALYISKTHIDKVKAMRNHMVAHLEKRFTLEDMATLFDIPLTSMKNCFKSIFGTPIHSYMREYRLQAAAAMLRETDAPVADISMKVGYETHSKFSAVFKSFIGVAPSEYRKIPVRKE
jgi:AraC-like DNA-binding protein